MNFARFLHDHKRRLHPLFAYVVLEFFIEVALRKVAQ